MRDHSSRVLRSYVTPRVKPHTIYPTPVLVMSDFTLGTVTENAIREINCSIIQLNVLLSACAFVSDR